MMGTRGGGSKRHSKGCPVNRSSPELHQDLRVSSHSPSPLSSEFPWRFVGLEGRQAGQSLSTEDMSGGGVGVDG